MLVFFTPNTLRWRHQDSDIDFTGVNLVELFDLARVVNRLAAGKILRIVGPTFVGVEDLCHGFDGTQGSGQQW